MPSSLTTAAWVAAWYVCAVVSNLTLKSYLNAVPSLAHVVGATWAAFAVAAVPCAVRLLRLRGDGEAAARGGGGILHGVGGGDDAATATLLGRVRAEMTRDALAVGVLHTLATGLTNVSILAGTLAYAHTIKATEPVFTSLLSRQLLNDHLPWTAHAAILVVVVGVILTSFSEGELSWLGLAAALAANVSSAARAVVFKRAYGQASAADAFARMSLVAAVLVTPLLALVAIALPTLPLSDMAATAIARMKLVSSDTVGLALTPELAALLAISSVTSAGYFACSFHVLTVMHAVSHALVNVMKRVVIILTSMVLFRSPATIANVVGIFIANVGIGAYSLILKDYHARQHRAAASVAHATAAAVGDSVGDSSGEERATQRPGA